ncbi:DUF5615 family PIN-like protein [candidate division KSB1 bacterium]|nr:DUF5615 family PIN-like protein [candidate division KSB1 bacterium]
MRFKLDQNMDPRAALILRQAGYDVLTVKDQNLTGADDGIIAVACQREQRCLITLDKDFSNKFLYPPVAYHGIIVLRHHKPTAKSLLDIVKQLCGILQQMTSAQKLWIVEPGRVRESN